MTLISMLFEALHGIVKCTGLDVAKWAGALAREHPANPPVELLIRRVWREDDPTEVTSEVIFARSTLIGREVPYKVFKRWALRDRTPIGPLLRPMDAAEVPYTGHVLLSMPEYRSALKTRCVRRRQIRHPSLHCAARQDLQGGDSNRHGRRKGAVPEAAEP